MDQRTRKLIIMHKALKPEMTLTDYMRQEKKEKEDELPAMETVLGHQYSDLKTIEKSAEEG